jgi:hypothetical protein
MSDVSSTFEQLVPYHIGYIVPDVRKAIKIWANVYGAGPFFYIEDFKLDELRCLGQPVTYKETFAYGKFGTTSIELLSFEVEEDIPELRAAFSELHSMHVGIPTEEPSEASARLEQLGVPVVLEGSSENTRYYLHDGRAEFGHFIEIVSGGVTTRNFQAAVDQMAAGWDGTNPLRPLTPESFDVELARILK